MSNKNGVFSNIKSDFPASIVVFLVALPLCMGIAVASGVPAFSGLIAGIVGGIIVGTISKSPLGVSGPAAGLIAVVIAAVADFGLEAFFISVALSGVFQIIFGVLKFGIIGYFFPNSVIKGMLSAIGIIIIFKEIPHAIGYDKDPIGEVKFIQTDGHNTFSELFYAMDNITLGAVVISLISLTILILWEKPFFKSRSIFNIIQGPLVVVVLGIVLGQVFNGTEMMFIGSEHFVSLPVMEGDQSFFDNFKAPDFSHLANPAVYLTAITLALIASLESLLCVEATDKLDPQKRITPSNRELIAQGAGNLVSGLIGGLPVTQVIVRSSANINSGGKTKLSAIMHGFLLLICVILIPNVLNMIPFASLAGILLMVGYKLANPKIFKEMFSKGKDQWVPFIITVVMIYFTDLLIGVGVGLGIGILFILINNFKNVHYGSVDYSADNEVRVTLAEEVSFLNKAGIMNTLNKVPKNKKVILDASRTQFMHPDVLDVIEDFKVKAKSNNITVELINL